MAQDLVLPDFAGDHARYAEAVRVIRDHLLGAVDVDREIRLDGRAYVVAWADRRPAEAGGPSVSVAAGMRVMDHGERQAEVVRSGEEQITLVIDGERFAFHLMEIEDDPSPGLHRPPRKALP